MGSAPRGGADAALKQIDQANQTGDAFLRRMVDGAHAAIDKLADAASPTVAHWSSLFANPSDKLANLAGQAGATKDEWVDNARQIIRENPFAAIATALVVGTICLKLTAAPRRANPDLDE